MHIDKDKNVGGDFGDAAADRIDGSAGKQLKVTKFKVLVAVINRKKSHLLKKTVAIKLS